MRYIYKLSKKGLPMYYKDGKLCSKDSIPTIVLENIKVNEPYEYEVEMPKEIVKECIFCGKSSNLTRMINANVVVLCKEHFYSENIGKIAQKLREKQNDLSTI